MSKSQVLSIRLQESQFKVLQRLARRFGRTPSETGAMLVEEGMRRDNMPYIEFRDSPVGRQAYVVSSSLAVWEVVMVGQTYDMDVAKTSGHLEWDEARVKAAFKYYESYADEIDEAIMDNESYDEKRLADLFPDLETLEF